MPSILSNPMPQQENERNIPDIMKSFAEKIMQTPNPEATFQQVLDSNPELKKLYDEMNTYAPNNPRQAFMNYATQKGKTSLANQIIGNFLSKLGLS